MECIFTVVLVSVSTFRESRARRTAFKKRSCAESHENRTDGLVADTN